MSTIDNYEVAKKIYASYGVDTDLALKRLGEIKLSIQCWQGDDVKGFLFKDEALSGGIQVTGHYPNKASTVAELRADLELAFRLIPGKHKVNLHAIYADTNEKVDLDELEPKHFSSWVDWALTNGLGLDFNPTCFSHQNSSDGFTLSSNDKNIRDFWVKHVKQSRKIAEYFGKSLNQKSVNNIWIPDGFKDYPYDRLAPRQRLTDSLNQIFSDDIDNQYVLDTMESKLFGIGSEAYTVGSHEFYLGYALKNNKSVCIDSGHFHPTESIADKIPTLSLYLDEMLLHVSRPMRWDSDHVVIQDDMANDIAQAIIRHGLEKRVHIGFDFFDASINRIAAWVVGSRSFQMSLLKALLEPSNSIKQMEIDKNYTKRMIETEAMKSLPFGLVYDYFCELNGVAKQNEWYDIIKQYEDKLER